MKRLLTLLAVALLLASTACKQQVSPKEDAQAMIDAMVQTAKANDVAGYSETLREYVELYETQTLENRREFPRRGSRSTMRCPTTS